MDSRSRSSTLVALAALGVLIASLVSAPAAAAADFRIWISPDRGPAGTSVTIYGVHDPAAERTVAWVCDSGENQVIDTVPVTNESWELTATVPADCVAGVAEDGVPVAEVLGYGGDGAAAFFRLTDTPADCPAALFIGAHGLNEGAAGGGTGTIPPDRLEGYWGSTIQATWEEFADRTTGERAVAADYPRTDYNWLETLSLRAAAQQAADALEAQVLDHFARCGTRTEIVLSGFSLGAWAVDMTLRSLTGSPAGRATLGIVAGAGVMGDPAYPPHFCDVTPCRQGVATWGGQGYATEEIYRNNGLAADSFISLCLSYSESERDIVCGTRNALVDFGVAAEQSKGLAIHNQYVIPSGGAARVGEFLAAQLS